MLRPLPLYIVVLLFSLATGSVRAAVTGSSQSQFTLKKTNGRTESVAVVTKYYPKKIQHPVAKVDRSIDPKLMRAASIAEERAHSRSGLRCWHFVKEALVAAGVIHSYPKTVYAKDAGHELVSDYGFKKLPVRDPFKAPVGAVLVYGATRAAGHVEIRTRDGFVSDFKSRIPSPRPLMGVYAKS